MINGVQMHREIGTAVSGIRMQPTMCDRPTLVFLPSAISVVTRRLKRTLQGAGFRWRKEQGRSVWWITSSSGFTTRLSYHRAIGWLVVSESPYDGPVIDELLKYLWRQYVDRFTA